MPIPTFLLNRCETLSLYNANHETFNPLNFIKFFLKSIIYRKNINSFKRKMLALKVPVTSQMLGVIEWPYIHNEWTVAKRFDVIAEHYSILSESYTNLMKLHQGYEATIINFGIEYEYVSVKLDRPKWFIREGEMVLNLFYQDVRVLSIGFSLSRMNDDLVVYVGAVQGIHGGISSEQSLNINKQLTKLFAGLRPQSLALEVLKVFIKRLNVSKIYGVSDKHRHHRHPYFGWEKRADVFKRNYDGYWEEHGGKFDIRSGFYIVDIEPAIRSLDDIPSKKRSQYRRRNEIVMSLNEMLNIPVWINVK